MPHNQPVSIPKHSAWLTQILVIRALLGREVATRFGEYHLGFFWMLVEPLVGVIIIGLIIGALAQRTVPEIPYAFFLLNGMMQMQLLTGCLNSGINAVGANKGLLVYPAVKPIDLFLARFIFHIITTLFSFSLFCAIGMWMGIDLSLARLGTLLACYLLTWLTGIGLGLIFGVAAAYSTDVEKIVPFIQRPLLFVSAVLFPLSSMPESARQILTFNPLVHTIEQARHALFPFYSASETNLFYPGVVALVCLAAGLTLFQNHRNFLSQS